MRFSKEIRHLFKAVKITRFPVGLSEIQQIIKHFGWEIYSYSEASDIIESCGLKEMIENNDSFAATVGDRIVIFYDDNISQLDFPRVLAHEVGHIALGQLNDVDDIYAKERDCDCFADELLTYVPKRFPPIIGTATAITLAIGIAGYFSAVKSDDIIETEDNTYSDVYSEVSVESETSIGGISETIYITKFGEKYHLAGCQYINGKDDLIEISIEEAENAGYEPCVVCFRK